MRKYSGTHARPNAYVLKNTFTHHFSPNLRLAKLNGEVADAFCVVTLRVEMDWEIVARLLN